jgi:hypothetical protein
VLPPPDVPESDAVGLVAESPAGLDVNLDASGSRRETPNHECIHEEVAQILRALRPTLDVLCERAPADRTEPRARLAICWHRRRQGKRDMFEIRDSAGRETNR